MLELDGSYGEGGGQIVRTALAAALTTATPFRIHGIRARRPRPGLRAQHLAAVRAAAAVSDAQVDGADLGSRRLTFEPRGLHTGDHRIDVGTAGSATLIAQMLLVPLLHAPGPSTVTVTGGTHNRRAPPADFLARAFLPLVNRSRGSGTLRIDRHGFEPAGGGRITLTVRPAGPPTPLDLIDAGPVRRTAARALLARLPRHIADRELAVVAAGLGWPDEALHVEEVDADGPGNALLLELERDRITEVVCAFGRRGLPAEQVAHRAVARARHYLSADIPVGPYLADQLLLPLAFAAGGSFRTVPPTSHFITNVHTLQRFMAVPVTTTPQPDGSVLVAVGHDAVQATG